MIRTLICTLVFLTHETDLIQEQGASCSVFCATVRELEGIGGYYFKNCCRCETSKEASNSRTASKLWQISQTMIATAETLATREVPEI